MKNSKQILAERCNVAAIRKEALAKMDALRDSYMFEGSLAKKPKSEKPFTMTSIIKKKSFLIVI